MSDETREINVEGEMLSPVNKLEALAQLFNSAEEGAVGLDASGTLGMNALLHSIANEILEIAESLDVRIADIHGKEPASATS